MKLHCQLVMTYKLTYRKDVVIFFFVILQHWNHVRSWKGKLRNYTKTQLSFFRLKPFYTLFKKIIKKTKLYRTERRQQKRSTKVGLTKTNINKHMFDLFIVYFKPYYSIIISQACLRSIVLNIPLQYEYQNFELTNSEYIK